MDGGAKPATALAWFRSDPVRHRRSARSHRSTRASPSTRRRPDTQSGTRPGHARHRPRRPRHHRRRRRRSTMPVDQGLDPDEEKPTWSPGFAATAALEVGGAAERAVALRVDRGLDRGQVADRERPCRPRCRWRPWLRPCPWRRRSSARSSRTSGRGRRAALRRRRWPTHVLARAASLSEEDEEAQVSEHGDPVEANICGERVEVDACAGSRDRAHA